MISLPIPHKNILVLDFETAWGTKYTLRSMATSEYVRDLIRRDQERERLRGLLLDGAASSPGPTADDSYFESLRDHVRSGD